MKLASVTFTTPENISFLEEVSPTWRHLAESFIVYENEDDAALLDKDGFRLHRSEFNRGTTLDGKDAVIGVLSTLRALACYCPEVDYWLKIDDDMVQTGDSFMGLLRSRLFHSVGQEIIRTYNNAEDDNKPFAQTYYAMGGAYVLSSEILRRLPEDKDELSEMLDTAGAAVRNVLAMDRPKGYKWPEDESIGTLMRMMCKTDEIAWIPDRKPFGMCREWDYRRYKSVSSPEFKRCLAFDFVHMRGIHYFQESKEDALETCLSVTKGLTGRLS